MDETISWAHPGHIFPETNVSTQYLSFPFNLRLRISKEISSSAPFLTFTDRTYIFGGSCDIERPALYILRADLFQGKYDSGLVIV